MKTNIIRTVVVTLIAMAGFSYVYAQAPKKCPFVNPNTGLNCLGVPVPDGYVVAGAKWKCTQGHTWIVK